MFLGFGSLHTVILAVMMSEGKAIGYFDAEGKVIRYRVCILINHLFFGQYCRIAFK